MLEIGNIKIPFSRMGVLIGKEGTVKTRIEEEGKVRLDIDSENATVTIFQKNDPLKALMAMNAVQAIARGFNPEKAMLLFDDSVQLIVISIKEFVNKDAKRIKETLESMGYRVCATGKSDFQSMIKYIDKINCQ